MVQRPWCPKWRARRRADTGGQPVSVRRATEEGMLIATSSLTMDVKNHIIVRALRDDDPFDAAAIGAIVTRELRLVAQSHSVSARRMDAAARTAMDATGPHANVHDYRPSDIRALRKRAAIFTSMARRLERLRHDDAFVAGVVIDARDRAWDDIGAAAMSRIPWFRGPSPDPDYENVRGVRLADLEMIDIFALTQAPPRP